VEQVVRVVALEEAFSLPGVIRQEDAIRQELFTRPMRSRPRGRSTTTCPKVVAEHPTRFAGFAALPLQDPEAAVVELRRAVEDLGLKGVLFNDHVRGRYLDEPQFRAVWAELERLGVTLYMHPAIVPVDNWRVFEGYPALAGPTWGWTAAVGAHALRLIYGGVFDEFPGASVTLGHMGELLPFQLARLDSRYAEANPGAGRSNCPRTICGTTGRTRERSVDREQLARCRLGQAHRKRRVLPVGPRRRRSSDELDGVGGVDAGERGGCGGD
jgi:hypothetical protein